MNVLVIVSVGLIASILAFEVGLRQARRECGAEMRWLKRRAEQAELRLILAEGRGASSTSRERSVVPGVERES